MAAVDRAIEVDELIAQWMLLDHEGARVPASTTTATASGPAVSTCP